MRENTHNGCREIKSLQIPLKRTNCKKDMTKVFLKDKSTPDNADKLRNKKKKKRERDNIEFERTKTPKQDFSLKSNSYCSREKGLSFIQSWSTGALQIISIKA